jgi:hypothetical protein
MVAFAPGAVLTAANLNTAFNALTIRTVTGTSDDLVLADNGGAVSYSNASATTSTIPPNSSVAYAVGTKIVLINLGAGVVTVTAGAGVTNVNGATCITRRTPGAAVSAGGTMHQDLFSERRTPGFADLPFSSGGAGRRAPHRSSGLRSRWDLVALATTSATGTYTGGISWTQRRLRCWRFTRFTRRWRWCHRLRVRGWNWGRLERLRWRRRRWLSRW